jgi:hypothetical protein
MDAREGEDKMNITLFPGFPNGLHLPQYDSDSVIEYKAEKLRQKALNLLRLESLGSNKRNSFNSEYGLSDYAKVCLEESSVYRKSCEFSLRRKESKKSKAKNLDKGVTFFILWLESLGIKTIASCEGHLNGWYILFEGSHNEATKVLSVLAECPIGQTISVELHLKNRWSLRMIFDLATDPDDSVEVLDKNAKHILTTGFDFEKAMQKELSKNDGC